MIQMTCLVMLLGNLVGGLLSTVLHAFEKPAPPRTFFAKPSARLFIIGEVLFISFAFYFLSMIKTDFSSWDIGYWIATTLMAPMFAIVGSQISKIALAEKLALNKKVWENIEAKQKAKAAAKKKEEETLNDKDANLTKLKDGGGKGTLVEDEANLTKLQEEDESFFDDSMNISNPND